MYFILFWVMHVICTLFYVFFKELYYVFLVTLFYSILFITVDIVCKVHEDCPQKLTHKYYCVDDKCFLYYWEGKPWFSYTRVTQSIAWVPYFRKYTYAIWRLIMCFYTKKILRTVTFARLFYGFHSSTVIMEPNNYIFYLFIYFVIYGPCN